MPIARTATVSSAALSGLILSAALLGGITSPASAQTALDKARRDDVFRIPTDDAKMAAAMRKAQGSLESFLAIAKTPKPSMEGFTVKVPLPAGDHNEYVWLQPFEVDADGKISGVLNNTPQETLDYSKGQTLTFPKTAVIDWGYYDGRRMMGNFTTCVLIEREPRDQAEAFKASYGLTCER